MKFFRNLRPAPAEVPAAENGIHRRGVVVGAGVAASAALAAAALHRSLQDTGSAPAAAAAPAEGEGYRLTEHVLRYYETTRS